MEIELDSSLIIFTGNYGSGKTEVAVNFAIHNAKRGRRVRLADLDIVNPYFRSREAAGVLEEHGVDVIVPPGELEHSENPIILPEIKGMIERPDGLSIIDVGGDDAGATVLGSFSGTLSKHPFELIQVVNFSRPFTDTVEGCLKIQSEIEKAARLRVTGIVSNTHLLDGTTPELILEGRRLAESAAKRKGLPLYFVCVEESLLEKTDLSRLESPVLPISRHLAPPWMEKGASKPVLEQRKDAH